MKKSVLVKLRATLVAELEKCKWTEYRHLPPLKVRFTHIEPMRIAEVTIGNCLKGIEYINFRREVRRIYIRHMRKVYAAPERVHSIANYELSWLLANQLPLKITILEMRLATRAYLRLVGTGNKYERKIHELLPKQMAEMCLHRAFDEKNIQMSRLKRMYNACVRHGFTSPRSEETFRILFSSYSE